VLPVGILSYRHQKTNSWHLATTWGSRPKANITAKPTRKSDSTLRARSDEDLKAELERLRNENAALKKGAASGIRMKVSEKGAVSIYGMGRFPVTLYREQWLKLLDMSDDIRAFIAANEAQLKTKHQDK
jgi:hypothetical protein